MRESNFLESLGKQTDLRTLQYHPIAITPTPQQSGAIQLLSDGDGYSTLVDSMSGGQPPLILLII